MAYNVLKEGKKFATFPTKEEAEDYCDMQRRKMKAAGLYKGPLNKFEDSKKAAAAKMKWDVAPA